MEWRATFGTPREAELADLFISGLTFDDDNRLIAKEGNSAVTFREGDRDVIISNLPREPIQNEIVPEYSRYGLLTVKPTFRLDYDPFSSIWPSGLFSDLTLVVGGQRFDVHRAILASVSPYFLALFTQMKEAGQPAVEIKDVDPVVFRRLLDLIYGARIEVDGLETLRLLILTERLQIKGIPVDNIIEEVKFEEEDLLEYLGLIRQLYSGKYPDWFFDHLFEKIIPTFETPIEELLLLLPEELQEQYDILHASFYGPSLPPMQVFPLLQGPDM